MGKRRARLRVVAVAAAVTTAVVTSLPPAAEASAPPEVEVRVGDTPITTVDERFLSIMVDLAQVVGGNYWCPGDDPDTEPGGGCIVAPFDFANTRLRNLSAPLAPAYLRLGGTKSDELYYDLSGATDPAPPGRYTDVMTRARWDGAGAFARDLDFRIVFTLNAGKGPRPAPLLPFLPWGAWDPANARELIEYSAAHGIPVDTWGLGNEPGYFVVLFGMVLTMNQYVADYRILRALVDTSSPGARVAGPAAAFWPFVGEWIPTFAEFARQANAEVDVLSWHWYPQQSRRCAFRLLPASELWALQPWFLDLLGRWADRTRSLRDAYASGSELWLHETGNAQCGGQPGLSDRFVAGFWWLDELGQAARRGTSAVMRTSLAGPDYALLESDLDPNPDYWNSLLWKKLMGPGVLAVTAAAPATVRLYAHCTPGSLGAATLLALNLDRRRSVRLRLPQAGAGSAAYAVTAPSLLGKDVHLNGTALVPAADGTPPELTPAQIEGGIDVAPASYTFVTLPPGSASACPP